MTDSRKAVEMAENVLPEQHDAARRCVLQTLGMGAVAGAVGVGGLFVPGSASAAKTPDIQQPVNMVVPKDFSPPMGGDSTKYRKEVTRAVMDYVQDNYSGKNLPVWSKPLSKIDLEKRVYNITYWILEGVQEYAGLYPVDPAWALAQVMMESFYYEFAISWAFAVGPFQFIPATARGYQMTVAGDKKEHGQSPYVRPELVGKYKEFRSRSKELYRLRKANRQVDRYPQKTLQQALTALTTGRKMPEAAQYLGFLERERELLDERSQAREAFKKYLRANFEGRSLFRKKDLRFLRSLDERVTYKKPARAMVHMLAQGLKARRGNMLASAAAYHAGLGRTKDKGPYSKYGRMPGIEDTVLYVSRILVVYQEIHDRMRGRL